MLKLILILILLATTCLLLYLRIARNEATYAIGYLKIFNKINFF